MKTPENPLRDEVLRMLRGVRRELGFRETALLKMVLGISGGEDSHVLLHVLESLSTELKLELTVCHLEHGLREESRADASFVQVLAERYGLKFICENAGPREATMNLEAWARQVRYEFLECSREKTKSHLIATAHHANDQAETILFRLLTNRLATSGRGIVSFDPVRRIVRPLLGVSKQIVRDYSCSWELDYRTDPTNLDLARSRNRIRHELIPLVLRDYNPNIIAGLSSFAVRLSADEDYLLSKCREIVSERPSPLIVHDLPKAIRWRVLRIAAERDLGEEAGKLGYDVLKWLSCLCGEPSPRGDRYDVGFGIICVVDSSGGLRFERLDIAGSEISAERAPASVLPIPGVTTRHCRDGSIALLESKIIKADSEEKRQRLIAQARLTTDTLKPASFAYFDLAALGSANLVVRERKPGDSMRVWKRGRRKVKKLLQERHLNLTERDSIPIVEWGGNILWIPGIARSDLAALGVCSSDIVELCYRRLQSEQFSEGKCLD